MVLAPLLLETRCASFQLMHRRERFRRQEPVARSQVHVVFGLAFPGNQRQRSPARIPAAFIGC